MKTLVLALLAFCLVMPACGPSVSQKVRLDNKERLTKLKLNMKKDDVLITMGTGTAYSEFSEPIPNPFRTEALRTRKGTYEILYYYTEYRKAGTPITDEHLTPLVIRNDRLVGWGWSALEEVRNE